MYMVKLRLRCPSRLIADSGDVTPLPGSTPVHYQSHSSLFARLARRKATSYRRGTNRGSASRAQAEEGSDGGAKFYFLGTALEVPAW
jgi:hypothetical protein